MAIRTWYFNPSTGNDLTGNGTNGNPYATFTKCLSVAQNLDTIDGMGEDASFSELGPFNTVTPGQNWQNTTEVVITGDPHGATWEVPTGAGPWTISNLTLNDLSGDNIVLLYLQCNDSPTTSITLTNVSLAGGLNDGGPYNFNPSSANSIDFFTPNAAITITGSLFDGGAVCGAWVEDGPSALTVTNSTFNGLITAIAGSWCGTFPNSQPIVANFSTCNFTNGVNSLGSRAGELFGTIDNEYGTGGSVTFTNCIINANATSGAWAFHWALSNPEVGADTITFNGGTLTQVATCDAFRFGDGTHTHTHNLILNGPILNAGTGGSHTNILFRADHVNLIVTGSANVATNIFSAVANNGTVNSSGFNAVLSAAWHGIRGGTVQGLITYSAGTIDSTSSALTLSGATITATGNMTITKVGGNAITDSVATRYNLSGFKYFVATGWTPLGTITYTTIPSTSVARSGADLIVTWGVATGADHYKISKDGGAFGSNVTSPNTDTGAASAAHYYTVRAYDSSNRIIGEATTSYSPVRPSRSPAGNWLPWLNTI